MDANDIAVLEKVQKIDYEMFAEFDKLCRKYDIEYTLGLGSLLGALRHKAMIPWDNDIDIFMIRREGDKVIEHRDELSDKYFWLGHDTCGPKKYFDCINRIGYRKAYLVMNNGQDEYYENNYNSIHLDMFLMDKTYDNFRGKFQRFELAFLYGLMNAYRHESLFWDYDKKMQRMNRVVCFLGRMIPLPWLKKRADKVARRFDNEDAPYYFISNDVLGKLKMLFPKEDIETTMDVPFGELTAKVVKGADMMCRKLYGDYMIIPPEEQQVPHLGRLLMTAESYVFEEPVRGRYTRKRR